MNQVEETKLAALRIMKAMTLVKQLRESYRELQTRFNMVENHNLELQDLINRVSADQSAVEEAIESALEGLESLGELESFGTLDLNELEDAEAFTLDGSSEEDLDMRPVFISQIICYHEDSPYWSGHLRPLGANLIIWTVA